MKRFMSDRLRSQLDFRTASQGSNHAQKCVTRAEGQAYALCTVLTHIARTCDTADP